MSFFDKIKDEKCDNVNIEATDVKAGGHVTVPACICVARLRSNNIYAMSPTKVSPHIRDIRTSTSSRVDEM